MRPNYVLILAGGVRPLAIPGLSERPTPTLPISQTATLLGTWLAVLRAAAIDLEEIGLVVSDEDNASSLESYLNTSNGLYEGVKVMLDPASWRGTAGLVRDCVWDVPGQSDIFVVEASCVPPASINGLVHTLGCSDVVIGTAADGQPAGIYAIRRAVLNDVPAVGYFDFKEQLVPRVVETSRSIRVARLGGAALRIQDQKSYLQAVTSFDRRSAADDRCSDHPLRVASIVEDGAHVEEDAAIINSVVLRGGCVSREAIVARSIIGEGVVVPPRGRVVDQVLTRSQSHAGRNGHGHGHSLRRRGRSTVRQ